MKVGFTIATGGDPRLYGIPLSLGYCAAVLKQEMPGVKILITQKPNDMVGFRPDIVGISCVSSCFPDARRQAIRIKRLMPDTVTVLGGPQITALPELLPPEFDYGVIWEGEDTFAELCQVILDKGDTTKVAGLCYHLNGEVLKTAVRQPRKSMDSLPFPLRSRNDYRPQEACIFTSRGCPFKCIFCASTRYWADFRMFTPEYFIDELQHILEQFPKTTSIYILDDLFIAKKERFRQMVNLLEKTGLSKRLTFHGFIKSSITDDDMMDLLKRMPMRSVRFGLESASPKVLNKMKGNSSVDDHVRCIELANKYGIRCGGSWMVGSPGETEEDLMMTIRFMKRWKSKGLRTEGFYLATPLPSTPLWDYALERGVVENSLDFDWTRLNLDWCNPDFNPDRACYLNDENMPIQGLIDILVRENVRKSAVGKYQKAVSH